MSIKKSLAAGENDAHVSRAAKFSPPVSPITAEGMPLSLNFD